MKDLTAGDHLDQYLLTAELARTAMAITFKGHDTETGKPVCLKVPHIAYESDVVFHERFKREERIGRRLLHRNVVRVLEPLAKSRMYLVTEFIPGTSLRSLIQARSLSGAEVLDVARQLLEALVYLHAEGVVHRDLKPENVILTPEGDVKLIDFGIALDRKARRMTWTRLSAALGTPDYMAPEQIAGRRGDERCDVYAVGLILYELLTGQLPFSGSSALAVMRAKTHEEPRPPTYFVPNLDPALDAMVCKAMARNARDRYQDAKQMLDALLNPHVESETAATEPSRRRPWIPGLVAGLVLGALASLTWLSGP